MKQKGRAIDLAAVRQSRARLDAIARAHPEMVQAPDPENRKAWEATLAEMENDMGRPPGPEPTETLALRLGESVVEALDRYRDELASKMPGFTVTRNDAMRRLLVTGLEREGVKVNKPKPPAVKKAKK